MDWLPRFSDLHPSKGHCGYRRVPDCPRVGNGEERGTHKQEDAWGGQDKVEGPGVGVLTMNTAVTRGGR